MRQSFCVNIAKSKRDLAGLTCANSLFFGINALKKQHIARDVEIISTSIRLNEVKLRLYPGELY